MPYLIKMYDSLDEKQLITIKCDAPEPKFEGHKIRVNENTNPLWFRSLCDSYLNNRTKKRNRKNKSDTKIQAIHVQSALKNMIKKGYSYSLYAEDFIEIARKLKNSEIKTIIYSEQGRNLEEITEECSELIDLYHSIEYSKEESFEIAEELKDCYNLLDKKLSKIRENLKSFKLEDEVPF